MSEKGFEIFYFVMSSNENPFRFIVIMSIAKLFCLVCSSSDEGMKYHWFCWNFMPIQLSAPNFCAKRLRSVISCCVKYFFAPFITLTSITIFLKPLLARRSGEGYLLLPEPATRMHTHLLCQNLWTNSLSASVPLAFLLRIFFGILDV